jgi:alpha-beta hydrolase superfamily lysophospholipase
MRNRSTVVSMFLVMSGVLPLSFFGCSSDDPAPATPTAGTGGTAGTAGTAGAGGGAGMSGGAGMAGAAGGGLTGDPEDKAAALAHLTNPCTDSIDSVYQDATPPSPWTAANRGDIVKCAYDRLIPVDEIKKFYTDNMYPVPTVLTGLHKLRVSYWTEDGKGVPVLNSASMYLPQQYITTPAPLLSMGHGFTGTGDNCADSKLDAALQPFTFSSRGWVSIYPDYPGFGTPGQYAPFHSQRNGHALLDGTRAARKLAVAGFFSTKNVLTGHSMGGHAVLSAQALAGAYGVEGTVEAVIAYAPAFYAQSSWGALLTSLASGLGADTPFALSSSLMYFMGHLAAEEGDTHRGDAFLPDQKDALLAHFDNSCKPADEMVAKGWDKAPKMFTAEYIDEVGNCALFNKCTTPLATTWRARFVADRPKIDANIPILLWTGGKDSTISPGRQACSIDRIKAQTEKFTVCGDAEAEHSDVIPRNAAWVEEYLEHILLGSPQPAACATFAETTGDTKCITPPANSTDPMDP